MSLAPVILNRGTPESWHIMPLFLERVRKFTGAHTSTTEDALPGLLAGAFGTEDARGLMIAILDDERQLPEALVGHVACGVETYLGRNTCMVYQFEKDESNGDWKTLNNSIQALIDSWCHTLGLDEIMIMAESDSRAKLFNYYGYERGPVLMRRKFNG
ncbi:MAG: hypothetical protein KAJ06_09210 [Gammaproteobacteria bacterium]|nr:hypothetical protein [Gammaproteobacteria bacterium]